MAGLPKTLPPCVAVELLPPDPSCSAAEASAPHQNGALLPFQDGAGNCFRLKFRSRRQLCSGEDVRPAFELTFSYEDGQGTEPFEPGSAVGVICPNLRNEVQDTLACLELTGDEVLVVGPIEAEGKIRTRFDRSFGHVPERCTVRYLLEYVVDLRTVLKKAFLKVLGDCCPEGSQDRERLYELSSTDAEAYRTKVLEGRMMIFDLLRSFPGCKPPLEVLVENLNRLSPRFYSVASYSANEVRLIYRPMQFLSQGRTLTGQCSRMFAELRNSEAEDVADCLNNLTLGESARCGSPGPKTTPVVSCYRRKNLRNFCFPTESGRPFMFVCHGTGIAPFLAYLDYLRGPASRKPSEFWLFYGCRYADRDCLVDPDKVRQSGCRLVLRQSRGNPARGVAKGFAQDGLKEYAEDVERILRKDSGHLLICGDFQTMARDTLAVLEGLLGKEEVADLQKENRIKLDVWT